MNDHAAVPARAPAALRAADRRRVLLLGATGLIGSAVAARLRSDGHGVVAVARGEGPAAASLRAERVLRIDLRDARSPDDWYPHLDGIDAVVNCAGVLQDGGRDSTAAVHLQAPAALYEACARRGIGRVVHISAMGAEREALSGFSATKGDMEDVLRRSPLDWVILRPSVVVGRAAYGGSALFRGLAALRWVPRLKDAGRISVVQLDDVVETIVRLLDPGAPRRIAVDLAGSQTLSVEEIVARYRQWLGWKPAKVVSVPAPVMGIGYALGDLAGRLGWRPPIRSTARREMARGAEGDPSEWTRLTGVVPASLDAALAREPASAQERWFARLFLLRPVAIVVFALFWILTGITSLGRGYDIGVSLMLEGGAGALSGPSVIAGGIADLLIGFAILWRRTARAALLAALAITIFYVIAGTAILPRLWDEPLGPMMKVWPILALNFILLAILEER
jgi:uncharacterized protein YbjT (DUF2867 family)